MESNNVAVGGAAGGGLMHGSNNVYVGAHAMSNYESDTLRIAFGRTRSFIGGIRAVTTELPNAVPVVIDSLGQLGTTSSSRRTKDHIEDLGPVSRAIFALRPVSFTYKKPFADGSTPIRSGLIAEEVEQVLPALVAYGADGQPETVMYHVLPTLLLAEVQRLERERVTQHDEIVALRTIVEQLQRQLATTAR